MNCPNCQNIVAEGMNNCPYCGVPLTNSQPMAQQMSQPMQQPTNQPMSTADQQQYYQQPAPQQTNANKPAIANRNIVMCVLLSILTCGIYGIYWFVCMTNDSNNLSEQNKTASGGVAFLLTIITCGIYGFYWYFKMGKKLHEAGAKYGKDISDNSILYLLLGFFGLGIVSEILIQSDLNKFAN